MMTRNIQLQNDKIRYDTRYTALKYVSGSNYRALKDPEQIWKCTHRESIPWKLENWNTMNNNFWAALPLSEPLHKTNRFCYYYPLCTHRQPIKLSDLDKSRMKRGVLLNKHFCKRKFQISPMNQQTLSISTFPFKSLWKQYVAIATRVLIQLEYQRTNGPVNAHLISWPSKEQNIQNLEKYMVKK